MSFKLQYEALVWVMRIPPLLFQLLLLCFLLRITPQKKGESCPAVDVQNNTHTDIQFAIPYTRCHTEPTPYVSSLLETAQYLLLYNHSLARFGNTEFDLMMGIDWYYQKAQKNLSERLLSVMTSNLDNLAVAVPDMLSGASELAVKSIKWWSTQPQYQDFLLKYLRRDKQYLNAYISAINYDLQGTYCSQISKVYNTLRCIWKGKDIIVVRGNNGEKYQHDVYDTARSKVEIIAPGWHAWNAYTSLMEQLLSEKSEKLIILAAGPVSKVLAYDLTVHGRRALDMGHLAKDYDSYMSGIIPQSFWYANLSDSEKSSSGEQ